ncbi:MAG: YbaK/EbsC family protein [Gammaproteobacteria bacterium]|nr:YbaK/EbsC family protein [Gammaproteobacteria bacterium]
MAAVTVQRYLDDSHAHYVSIQHTPVYTAQEIAEAAHVSGYQYAKVVIAKVKNALTMLIVPACERVDIAYLQKIFSSQAVSLVPEKEFSQVFADCERGAIPPFGHLYHMPVYLSRVFHADRAIVFNAGLYNEAIQMPYKYFINLVNPDGFID